MEYKFRRLISRRRFPSLYIHFLSHSLWIIFDRRDEITGLQISFLYRKIQYLHFLTYPSPWSIKEYKEDITLMDWSSWRLRREGVYFSTGKRRRERVTTLSCISPFPLFESILLDRGKGSFDIFIFRFSISLISYSFGIHIRLFSTKVFSSSISLIILLKFYLFTLLFHETKLPKFGKYTFLLFGKAYISIYISLLISLEELHWLGWDWKAVSRPGEGLVIGRWDGPASGCCWEVID